MNRFRYHTLLMIGAAWGLVAITGAIAEEFNIPGGDLKGALDAYSRQAGVPLVYSGAAVQGVRSGGVRGDLPSDAALVKLLRGTGFVPRRNADSAVTIVHPPSESRVNEVQPIQLAQAAQPPRAAVETVTVTSSKLGGADVQSVPIAITALSQEQLTSRQIAGGPDLVKEVPNLTFSKTNFTGYNIEIRGIGTQAISVTTDPAVAVALNDIPFIRNHFFEQEFFDVNQVEVLRGPQGTLYGRNATAGVVNVISAKPTDQFEAMLSADWGNYQNRRYEGMVNIPIVDDRVDLRVAGEWTKRDGYSFDSVTDQPIDGRDLWSTRVTLGLHPTSKLQTYLVWEHFSEDDDRLRSGKQLCKTDVPPTSIGGQPVTAGSLDYGGALTLGADYLSQGCLPTSLYSPDAFEVPYGFSLPYAVAAGATGDINPNVDPYASTTQSRNLRVIESALTPHYRARNDTLEFNAEYALSPSLTFTSQTGYNRDFLWSIEDYNRFNTSPGIFIDYGGNTSGGRFLPDPSGLAFCGGNGCSNDAPAGSQCNPNANDPRCFGALLFCDPQLGCSDRLVGEDLSEERAWQLGQEFRLASNFSGPLNFSVGGNYLHYETEENYYVFINALTVYSMNKNSGSAGDQVACLNTGQTGRGYQYPNDSNGAGGALDCVYLDMNPIGSLNNKGHNYFLSQNPYNLNSYAAFGEIYYNIASDLKFTGGLRWTEDRKRFIDIPSQLVTDGYGYPVSQVVDQQWNELTGRSVVNWTPKLDFTDQTLVYASYSRGYKAGGANPPGATLLTNSDAAITNPIHPLTFKPEFIDAYELGSKNTMLDGALTLNGDVFYYDYKAYQISEIVDRTSINLNFNATVKGAELETSWEAVPGLKFSFAGGYEDTRIANGQSAVDLIDRTAGTPGWMVVKPFVTQASNCILPTYLVAALLQEDQAQSVNACVIAYQQHLDPATLYPYQANPNGPGNGLGYENQYHVTTSVDGPPVDFTIAPGYIGFNPSTVPNNGEGFAKPLGGNQLPNAPHFTTSLSADYTLPVSPDWAATLHGDFYWQSQSFARVFNDRPYDQIHGYSNVNLALILTGVGGWQVMGYLKNVFNTTAITGDFLNSDDSGLTTNVFLTDPRLFGVRVTKNW